MHSTSSWLWIPSWLRSWMDTTGCSLGHHKLILDQIHKEVLISEYLYWVRDAVKKKKKLLRRRHWSILIYPSPPCLNGTSRIGTYKIGHWPHPPSSNRDKLHFSRDELVNTVLKILFHWIWNSIDGIFWKKNLKLTFTAGYVYRY